jgi:hypothetical protein
MKISFGLKIWDLTRDGIGSLLIYLNVFPDLEQYAITMN